MRAGPWCAISLLLAALGAGCGEHDLRFIAADAEDVVATARTRFKLLDDLVERGLEFERVEGGFRPVAPPTDTRGPLVDSHSAFGGIWRKPGNHHIRAELPARAGGIMRLSNGPVTIAVRPLGVRNKPGAVAGRSLVYRDAYPGADSIYVAEKEHLEEFILLRHASAPKWFEYEVKIARGGGRIRQNAGVVEVLDGEKNAWLRLERPYLVDGDGVRHELELQLQNTRLRISLPANMDSYPILVDPGWSTTGKMTEVRALHQAVQLLSGKVLVLGGQGSGKLLTSAELYNHKTGTWTTTGSMAKPHTRGTATRLVSGVVLVAGGYHQVLGKSAYLSSAELYDPAAGTWKTTGSMIGARYHHTATRLGSGQVLVAGGNNPQYLKSAERYDAASGKWSKAGDLPAVRSRHRAALLNDGKALLVGGACGSNVCGVNIQRAAVYDPATSKWASTAKMTMLYTAHTITVLPSGAVLVVGRSYSGLTAAELFNPKTGKWSKAPTPAEIRKEHTATLLPGGKVMVAGGEVLCSPSSCSLASVELFDPVAWKWAKIGSMTEKRRWHTATLLPGGSVLISGGARKGKLHQSAERFLPTAGLPCAKDADCAGGYCADGICCASACLDTCRVCVKKTGTHGDSGQCVHVPAGKPDLWASSPCTNAGLCDGNGKCSKGNGVPCAGGTGCGTGECVDGVCCEAACQQQCYACNIKGHEGTCWPVPRNGVDPGASTPCHKGMACDGSGDCLPGLGQPCTSDSKCASDGCKDGVCCDTACDKICESCSLKSSTGTCTAIPAKVDPDGECIGKEPSCGGVCSGARQCIFPNIGKGCGLCKACDGTGQCSMMPPDDPNCGVIDCDLLDTKCRDYRDLEGNRCDSLGICKTANYMSSCVNYTELCSVDGGAKTEAGPDVDMKVKRAPSGDAGCGCGAGGSVSDNGSGTLALLLMFVVAIIAREAQGRNPNKRGGP